ncbi:DinB family protein [Psychrobacillus sp. FJAT-51614]|uniref:DinB family protein n=1 Tax=Psychrobacillus mangrovi TaxID=3117745 RepID=A0ABU8F8G6_9BACI
MINDAIKQLQFISDTILELFEQVDNELLNKRPVGNKMSVWEVCQHLSQIPGADLHIQKGYSEQQMTNYYQTNMSLNIQEVKLIFITGIQDLISNFENLTEDELEERFTTYWGSDYSRAEWFIQIVNHLVHHRMQLYQYFLLLNQEVHIVLFR